MADDTSAAIEFDIDKQRLGSVYAKAFLAAAEQSGADALVEELDSLVDDVLTRFPGFEATLASPRISPAEKEQLLDRVLQGQASEALPRTKQPVGW